MNAEGNVTFTATSSDTKLTPGKIELIEDERTSVINVGLINSFSLTDMVYAEFSEQTLSSILLNGISVYDVFARTKSIIPLYAQAYWYGQDEDLSYEEFKAEQEILGDGPQVESSHRIESADSMICSFDMNEAKNEEGDSFEISDHSGNGYDARVVQGELSSGTQDRQLVLENDGDIEMRHRSLGWPYTVAFELKWC